MNGQQMKAEVNRLLDEAADRYDVAPMVHDERMTWWCSPQGGVKEPYLLTLGGTDEQRLAVVQAAKEWTP